MIGIWFIIGLVVGFFCARILGMNDTYARELEERMRILEQENARLKIRLLSAAGDDLCRLTPEEIKAYSNGTVKIPPKSEFLPSCERFHNQIAKEVGVMVDCLTLAQMIAENEKLMDKNRELEEYIKVLNPMWGKL